MTPRTRLAISCTILAGALLVIQLRTAGEAIPIRKPLESFPAVIAGWHAREDTPLQTEIVDFLKLDDYLMRRYVDDHGNALWLYVGYWAGQRRGAAQVHSPKNCLPAGGWEPVEASRLTIAIPGRGPITVNRYLVQKAERMQVVLYWYQARGKTIAGEVPAKIEMVRSAILRHRTDGALVRVSAPVSRATPEAMEWLVRYVQAIYPLLAEHLPD